MGDSLGSARDEGAQAVGSESGGVLFDFWYRAAQSDSIGRATRVRCQVLETRLVVGRDRAGRAFALLDACPHRGMPLSYGWFDGETVQCAYHGWRFDAQTGQCRFIPSLTASQQVDVGKVFAGHLPCEERDGFIWVYLSKPEASASSRRLLSPGSPPGPAPALPVHSERYRSFCLSSVVPISADHGLASLLDPVHGTFVHARVWWFARLLLGIRPDRGENASVRDVTRDYVPLPLGFREVGSQPITAGWFRRHAQADVTEVTSDLVLPGHRLGEIRAGRCWISGFTTVTPITRSSCRIDMILAWNLFYWWPFAVATVKLLFWVFFVQDKWLMTRQAEGVSMVPRPIFIDDADKPVRWYYQLKRAYLESREGGGAFEHPLGGKVTLTWRSPHGGDIVR
jgi:phenylpropionate dioxygenase-like ring-hydroxylating dioxygenase large terminal subunit